METATVERTYDVPPGELEAAVADVEGFYDAAGFDVDRDGDRLELGKRLAVARFELDVRLLEGDDAALAYEQVDGPFAEMRTRYLVEPAGDESRLRIETSFEPPASGFGSFVNGALVERQRRTELDAVADLLAE